MQGSNAELMQGANARGGRRSSDFANEVGLTTPRSCTKQRVIRLQMANSRMIPTLSATKIWKRKARAEFLPRSLHLEPKWFGHLWHQVVASLLFQAPRNPNGVFYLFLIILRIGLNKYHTPSLPPTQLLKVRVT